MDEKSVDELAQSAFEKGGIDAITSYLPFMSDDKVLRLARLVCKRDGTGALKKYLPFLRDDGLRQLMKEFVEK